MEVGTREGRGKTSEREGTKRGRIKKGGIRLPERKDESKREEERRGERGQENKRKHDRFCVNKDEGG